MCFGFSKEPSQLDGSFEEPQHMFWLRNKKIIFINHPYLGACHGMAASTKNTNIMSP